MWVVAVHTIKTSWKQKTIFDDSLGENPWGKPKKTKNLEKTQQKTIFGDSLGKPHRQNQKKLEKTKKKQKNKTFQRMFGQRLMFVFLVLPRFFCFFFGLDLEKTKKTQGFLFFG